MALHTEKVLSTKNNLESHLVRLLAKMLSTKCSLKLKCRETVKINKSFLAGK